MPENKTPYADGSLSYEGHKKIAQFIVQNTSGKPYELKRVGYNDTFDKQFAQNYIYLLWYYGNEPVKKANITYTIVEDGTKFNRTKKKNLKMYIINNVIILKEIK